MELFEFWKKEENIWEEKESIKGEGLIWEYGERV